MSCIKLRATCEMLRGNELHVAEGGSDKHLHSSCHVSGPTITAENIPSNITISAYYVDRGELMKVHYCSKSTTLHGLESVQL